MITVWWLLFEESCWERGDCTYCITFLTRKPVGLAQTNFYHLLYWDGELLCFTSFQRDMILGGAQVVLLCACLCCGVLQEFNFCCPRNATWKELIEKQGGSWTTGKNNCQRGPRSHFNPCVDYCNRHYCNSSSYDYKYNHSYDLKEN